MLSADNMIDNVQMMQWKEYVREFATLSSQSGHINVKVLLIKVCSSSLISLHFFTIIMTMIENMIHLW